MNLFVRFLLYDFVANALQLAAHSLQLLLRSPFLFDSLAKKRARLNCRALLNSFSFNLLIICAALSFLQN
jgi:hypothetical protein